MKIYGDFGSGNCLKVKYTADKLGLAYDWVPIDTMKGETRTPDFLARFPMARIPGVGRVKLDRYGSDLLALLDGSGKRLP